MPTTESFDRRQLVARIRQRMTELGTNAKAVSRAAKIGETGVHDILSGHNKNPSVPQLASIASALGCTVSYLIGEDNQAEPPTSKGVAPIPVVGIAEAGAFRKMAQSVDAEHELPTIAAPRSDLFPNAKHFAFEVRGDSMNAAKPTPIVDGMHVLCVDVVDAGLTIESGRIYLVRQTRDAGQTYETTVKRARVFKDRVELHPESTNQQHAPMVIRPGESDTNAHRIEAIGWVYGVYASLE